MSKNFCRRWSPFFAEENDPSVARRRAERNKDFWSLLYSGAGLSYADLCHMDLAEYAEAVEARVLYIEEIKQLQEGSDIGG